MSELFSFCRAAVTPEWQTQRGEPPSSSSAAGSGIGIWSNCTEHAQTSAGILYRLSAGQECASALWHHQRRKLKITCTLLIVTHLLFLRAATFGVIFELCIISHECDWGMIHCYHVNYNHYTVKILLVECQEPLGGQEMRQIWKEKKNEETMPYFLICFSSGPAAHDRGRWQPEGVWGTDGEPGCIEASSFFF